jgi:chromate transport protein ChrA
MMATRTPWRLVRYFLYLGSLSFGGPAALLLWRFKIPEPLLIIAAGLIGVAVFWLRGTP